MLLYTAFLHSFACLKRDFYDDYAFLHFGNFSFDSVRLRFHFTLLYALFANFRLVSVNVIESFSGNSSFRERCSRSNIPDLGKKIN